MLSLRKEGFQTWITNSKEFYDTFVLLASQRTYPLMELLRRSIDYFGGGLKLRREAVKTER